ncbi:MAG: NmrA family NAD(P)-binding protein [Tildeniella nuda ZEHNDER 1965/U140]|jgi:uncharacterized protein YbjT (DUF2867 family)|nr:NmrA family NAD(P)-binding protein [Tildeniella nuda ZEHNDER 1965/U140]
MHIILGGTGHIGSSLASALLERGEAVTVVGHTPSKAHDLQRQGANFATANVNATKFLRRVIQQGKRLFVLNPPADPSTDIDVQERQSLNSILQSLNGVNLEKIVAESTYGAQSGDDIGDLGVLYEMEQSLTALPVPVTILRGAYYMSNWDIQVQSACANGVIQTFFPVDFKLPMVAPADIGQIAARFMTEPAKSTELHHVEGTERYSSEDVAIAFAAVLNKPMRAAEIPRSQWLEAFKRMGFSEKAAVSFANMTAATIDGQFPDPDVPIRGATSLQDYLATLVEQYRAE